MSARVPVMITKKMRKELRDQGLTAEQIANLNPVQAWEILGGMPDDSPDQAPAPAGESQSNIPVVLDHFTVAVNRGQVGKIPQNAPKGVWKKFNGDFKNETLGLEELTQAIAGGYAITASLSGYRKRDNFKSSQILGLDFDTEDERSTLDALQSDPFIEQYAAILHTSSSHTPEKPRARALFVLDQAITDADLYGQIAAALTDRFGIADDHCKDPARLWFGAKDCEFRLLYNVLPLEVVRSEILEPYQEQIEERKQTARRRWEDNKTPELQEIADALRYIPAWGEYDDWLKILMAVHSVYPGPEGIALIEAWSPGYNGEVEYKFKSFQRSGVTIATLFGIAKEYGYRPTHQQSINTSNNGYHPAPPLGASLSPAVAEQVEAQAQGIPSPDPDFTQAITELLSEASVEPKYRHSVTTRRKRAGQALLSWLENHGEFVKSESDELYYLFQDERRLYNLRTNNWRAWLYSLTGANPAGTDYAYLQADCETAGLLADVRSITRLSSWDPESRVLRVSRFDGTVYVLDGKTISEEGNGENVLFDDSPFWKPYAPDFSKQGIVEFLADAYFDGDKSQIEQYKLAQRAWHQSVFFTELMPTRPFAAFVGVKGSGKSMTIRRFGRVVFGPSYEISGVPDKPDGFTASAAAAHLLAIDNLDEFHGWMRDKIARLSTGGVDEYRVLYTSNEVGRVRYRCWMAFTSRTPETLRRDDLADRALIFPVKRIPDDTLKAERAFLDATDNLRNAWWGDMLTHLNRIVAEIRAGNLHYAARLRMGDWESFGRLVAQIEGKEDIWNAYVQTLKMAQSGMLLDDNLVCDALLTWLEQNPQRHGQEIKSSELYTELTEMLFPNGKKPSKDWPKSTTSFGKRMQEIREALAGVMAITWRKDRNKSTIYQISPKNAEGAEGADSVL